MTGTEILYLTFVVGAFSALAGLLAFVSWDEKRRQKRLGLTWYRPPE